MVSAWRNFKIFFSRPLFIIIFRPKMLFFVKYSILTGDTKVEFVIYWVFRIPIQNTSLHHAAEMVHHVVGRQIFAAEKWAIVSKDPN